MFPASEALDHSGIDEDIASIGEEAREGLIDGLGEELSFGVIADEKVPGVEHIITTGGRGLGGDGLLDDTTIGGTNDVQVNGDRATTHDLPPQTDEIR